MLTETTRQFFARLSEIWPNPVEKKAMTDLVASRGENKEDGASTLSRIPVFNAVLRNGISPTVVQGGKQFNVIPDSAGAVLNVRTLPGQSVDEVVERMRAAVTEPGVAFEITQRGQEAPASDPASPMFQAITESAHELDPGIVLLDCPHHLGRRATLDKENNTHLTPPTYPYHLVLRAGGEVERVPLSRIRQFFRPGKHLMLMSLYPGEPGYEQGSQ